MSLAARPYMYRLVRRLLDKMRLPGAASAQSTHSERLTRVNDQLRRTCEFNLCDEADRLREALRAMDQQSQRNGEPVVLWVVLLVQPVNRAEDNEHGEQYAEAHTQAGASVRAVSAKSILEVLSRIGTHFAERP